MSRNRRDTKYIFVTGGVVSSLGKEDASLFTTLCQFNWSVNCKPTLLVVPTYEAQLFWEQKIDFGSLSHLAYLGLFHLLAHQGATKRTISRDGQLPPISVSPL